MCLRSLFKLDASDVLGHVGLLVFLVRVHCDSLLKIGVRVVSSQVNGLSRCTLWTHLHL